MTHPTITFVDDQGALPYRDGAQFTVQYERADWWVRLSQPWQGRVVIDGPEPLELTRRYGATGTEWIVPPLGDDLRVHVDAGQVRVMLVDSDGQRLPNSPSAVLNILPANVDEAEMSHMLERIALLAVSAASHTTAIMPLPSVEPLGESIPGLGAAGAAHHMRLVSQLLELYDTLRISWDVIRQKPLKSMTTGVGPIRSSGRNTSPQSLIATVMHPSGRDVLGITMTDSLDCPETAFVYYVLDYVKWLARAFLELIADSETSFEQRLDIGGDEYAARMSVFVPDYLEKTSALRHRLEECYHWAEHACHDPLFSETVLSTSVPQATRRLRGTPGYSSAYQAFTDFWAAAGGGVNRGLSIFRSVVSKSVRPTWQVYEIWCFVQLYMMLVSDVGMRPPRGTRSILDALEIADDELRLCTGSDGLPLTLKVEDGCELKVTLSYNELRLTSQGSERYPDIYAVVEYGDKMIRVCFDAKYRDYRKQGFPVLAKDVIETAKTRYLQQLGLDVSFIMHTDSTVNYWGEQPFAEYAMGEFDENDANTEFAGHRYGAVHFAPDESLSLQCRRIIFLVFRYHMVMTSVCLDCAKALVTRVRPYGASGVLLGSYRCPECGRRWVVQHCRGAHHLILKTGSDCIHRPTQYADWGVRGGMYSCPQCGNDFPKADLQEAFNPEEEPPYYGWH